jgi:hypothetical protein
VPPCPAPPLLSTGYLAFKTIDAQLWVNGYTVYAELSPLSEASMADCPLPQSLQMMVLGCALARTAMSVAALVS